VFAMERNYAIDYFKCIAMFFVVCIHTHTLEGVDLLGIKGNSIDFVINTFSRFAVPYFFMVSGYLIGFKKIHVQNFESYFKKYVIKISKLFLSWYLVYILYDLFILFVEKRNTFNSEALRYLTNAFNFKVFLYGPTNGAFHLWFLVALVWSVVILYLFIKLDKLNFLLGESIS
jgi:surface polysaccharide O-acyltransferase-like enzyme